jgi:hypothetical protein
MVKGEITTKSSDKKTVDDILCLFTPAVRKNLNVEVKVDFALLELKRYNKSNWNKIMNEVRGYGGEWVKGHFKLPLVTIGLGEN